MTDAKDKDPKESELLLSILQSSHISSDIPKLYNEMKQHMTERKLEWSQFQASVDMLNILVKHSSTHQNQLFQQLSAAHHHCQVTQAALAHLTSLCPLTFQPKAVKTKEVHHRAKQLVSKWKQSLTDPFSVKTLNELNQQLMTTAPSVKDGDGEIKQLQARLDSALELNKGMSVALVQSISSPPPTFTDVDDDDKTQEPKPDNTPLVEVERASAEADIKAMEKERSCPEADDIRPKSNQITWIRTIVPILLFLSVLIIIGLCGIHSPSTLADSIGDCLSEPCCNGALCEPNQDLNGYQCICPIGYQGTHCQDTLNSTDSFPLSIE
jgi:EGF-like domain